MIFRSVLALGNFDGVHLGHQALLKKLQELSKAFNLPGVIFTFTPHPQHSLQKPGISKLPLITSVSEKKAWMHFYAPEFQIHEENFTHEFSQMTPEVFFQKKLMEKFAPQALVVGQDFGFGKGRSGDLSFLTKACEESKVKLEICPWVFQDQQRVSSTLIRETLLQGNLERAKTLLGRPYSFDGVVQQGDQRGRMLGFPTANVWPEEEKLLVDFGVYAGTTQIGGKSYGSISYLGVRPTFLKEPKACLETHLLGIDEKNDFLYGHKILVFLIEKIREEKKFESAQALVHQIQQDTHKACVILSKT